MSSATPIQSAGLETPNSEVFSGRFLAPWRKLAARSRALPLIVFILGLTLICGATVFIGIVPTKVFGHDVFVPLEIGWRIINGQRPHLDFMSAWGPVWFLVTALGLKISGYSVNGIGYANAITAFVIGSWCFLLGKNRLLPSLRIILSLFLAALVASPYPLGGFAWQPSHAMVYNRYGFAILGLILLECLERARAARASKTQEMVGGISTGAALALALFLKASYFFVGIVLVGVISVLLKRLGRRRLLGLVLGFSGVSICLLAYLRFNLIAMLRDLRMAGGARAQQLSSKALIYDAGMHASVLLAVLLFAVAASLVFGNRVAGWRGLRLPIVAVLLFGADIGLMSTNFQWDGFPLCAVFGILIVNEIMQDMQTLPAKGVPSLPRLYAGTLFLGALLFVPQFTSDIAGLAYGAWLKTRSPSRELVPRFTLSILQPLLLYDGSEPRSNGRVFTAYVNDGVALLERESRPEETILSMDMTNPFPYALQRRPAHGGVVAPTFHLNMDDQHRPSFDRFFGDADIVMVPKRPAVDDYLYIDFLKAYAPGIKQRYNLAAETNWWWMYRRK